MGGEKELEELVRESVKHLLPYKVGEVLIQGIIQEIWVDPLMKDDDVRYLITRPREKE